MEIKEMTGLALADAIRKGKTSVREAVKESLDQIRRQDGRLHAFLETEEEEAYARAEEVENGIRSGKYTSPLAGVPVAVKDNICTRGRRTTCGSKMLESFVPTYDAEAVRRLKEAGMIVIGKTNMDEFAMGSTSETSAFGITRNPWDTSKAPGGSSGGSCAAVAAEEVAVALGSDTGGSIRQPASYCGVTGIKPTYGTVSRYGLIAYASSLDQIGTVGKSVSDCTALLEIIAGHDPKDSTSLGCGDVRFTQYLGEKLCGMRIGIPREYLAEGIQDEVREAVLEAAALLENNGAKVSFFSLGFMEYVIPAYYIIASAEASSNLARFDGVKYGYRTDKFEDLHGMYKKTRAEGFGKEVKRRIMLGSFVLSSGYYDAYYLKALKARNRITRAFDEAFESYDVLLAPAAPSTAPRIGSSLSDPLKMYLGDVYTAGVNLAGLPALSIPCGRDKGGMPIGLQFISGRFGERKIIRAANSYEKLRGAFPKAAGKEEQL